MQSEHSQFSNHSHNRLCDHCLSLCRWIQLYKQLDSATVCLNEEAALTKPGCCVASSTKRTVEASQPLSHTPGQWQGCSAHCELPRHTQQRFFEVMVKQACMGCRRLETHASHLVVLMALGSRRSKLPGLAPGAQLSHGAELTSTVWRGCTQFHACAAAVAAAVAGGLVSQIGLVRPELWTHAVRAPAAIAVTCTRAAFNQGPLFPTLRPVSPPFPHMGRVTVPFTGVQRPRADAGFVPSAQRQDSCTEVLGQGSRTEDVGAAPAAAGAGAATAPSQVSTPHSAPGGALQQAGTGSGTAAGGGGAAGYRRPPPEIAAIVDAPTQPSLSYSPDRRRFLQMQRPPSLPPIAEMARPELKLAGGRYAFYLFVLHGVLA
jgi:hypothetical protein